MRIIESLTNKLSLRRLWRRADQIRELTFNENATVYPREILMENTPGGRTVLVLTPHADDETFGAGGAMLRHKECGDRLVVALFSDNVASVKDGGNKDEIREMREGEYNAAMRLLGADDARAFRLSDETFSASSRPPEELLRLLIEIKPDLLYLPSLFDNHHDHRVLNRWACEALARTSLSIAPMIRGYEVWSPLPATAVLDVTSLMERKSAVIRCYPSQLSEIDYEHHILGLNAYRAMTLGRKEARYAECFLEMPADRYRAAVASYLSVHNP